MTLRPLKDKDAPLMLEWMHDPDIVRDMHRDFASMTIDDCLAFIRSAQKNTDRNLHLAITGGIRNQHSAITDSDRDTPSVSDDEYLGTVSLKNIDHDIHTAEFGITVRRCAMGSGAAADAMKAILTQASDLGIKRVYWCVSPNNERALRFYDKNHYTRVFDMNKTHADIYASLIRSEAYTEEEAAGYVWYIYETAGFKPNPD